MQFSENDTNNTRYYMNIHYKNDFNTFSHTDTLYYCQ